MSPRDLEVFDSAVDYVERPSVLGGRWAESAQAELADRIRASDVVLLGTVQTIRSDEDAARRRTRRVVLSVDETLFGDEPGDEISLPVNESEPGYDTVVGHDSQLLQHRFVVTVKWAHGDAGSVVPRWHLSPASDPIRADVNRLVRLRVQATSGN